MNGVVPSSAIRFLPVETDISPGRASTSAEPGFHEMLHSAIDDIQKLEEAAQAEGFGSY